MALSTYAANLLINKLFRGVDFTASNWRMALFTGTPPNPMTPVTGSMTNEVTGAGYTRKPITFTAAASRATDNAADVTFDPASASWGTITHAGIVADIGGSDYLIESAAGTGPSVTVNSGNQFRTNLGDYDFSFT